MSDNHENVTTLLKEAGSRVADLVAATVELYKRIKWRKVVIEIPIIPEPSHRPRLSGYRVYVPGAAKNQRFFNKHVLPKLHDLFITKPCKVDLDIYCPTPKSFNRTQKIIAEMGILRPWVNTGDVDNYAKAALDMIQPNEKRGHIGIMENDCLVYEMMSRKFYSINPRYVLSITYMDTVPSEIIKLLRLKGDDEP
jgi:Holliday junction resolvase RusA-like endonuclease